MVLDSDYPGQEYARGRGELRHGLAHRCQEASPIYESPEYAGKRINILTENQGFLVNEYVAQHSAERSGNCTHDNGDPDRESKFKALRQTDDHKQAQTDRVEYEERVVQPDDVLPEGDHEKECQAGDDHVGSLGHPKWNGVQHDVPERSATNGGYQTDNISPKPIKLFSGSQSNTTYGKCECPNIVAKRDKIYHFVFTAKLINSSQ